MFKGIFSDTVVGIYRLFVVLMWIALWAFIMSEEKEMIEPTTEPSVYQQVMVIAYQPVDNSPDPCGEHSLW